MAAPNRYSRDGREGFPPAGLPQRRPVPSSTQRHSNRPLPHRASEVLPPHKPQPTNPEDVYSYALRCAYLSYILQPRQKRVVNVTQAAPVQKLQKPKSSSATDLVKHFSGYGSTNTNKLPSSFMPALEKRIRGVIVGTEKLPEFADPAVKKTFANFFNKFLDPARRRSLDADRKVEQLLLVFYSSAVEVLRSGKPPDDDSWILLTDRHLALFCRLIIAILTDNEWAREKVDLMARLQSMEKKLLTHDLDLSTNSTSQTMEVEVPLSYEVKEMPYVLLVSRIFGISYAQLQDDVNRNRNVWTEEAALKDLKMYQQALNFRVKNILKSDDFDTEEAYEAWKKHEIHDVSEMLFLVLQANPKLAMTSSGGSAIPQLSQVTSHSDSASYEELSRRMSEQSTDPNNVLGTLESLSLTTSNERIQDGVEIPFTYVPPDSRAFFREVVKYTIVNEIADQSVAENSGELPFLSKKTADFIHEVAARWRVPSFTRRILFLDAVKLLYQERAIDPLILDKALEYFKQIRVDKKSHRKSVGLQDLSSDWTKWTMKDLATYQQSFSAIHECMLKDLFDALQRAYETEKGKDKLSYGIYLSIIQSHLEDDDLFRKSTTETEQFSVALRAALTQRATERYQSLSAEKLPTDLEDVEFFHVIELGKGVLALSDRIRKRFRNSPDIYGVKMLDILVESIFPAFARDAKTLVHQIMASLARKDEVLPLEDGFQLYRELVNIRDIHHSVLPDLDFEFDVEDDLQEFVWRFTRVLHNNLTEWVDNAFKQDDFKMIVPPQPGMAVEEQRHSSSAFYILKSFREAKQQISELNWANSYQNAKFMTSLAKSMSMGVERYCELLEQRFSKEMDRPTPEQEAMMKQTNSDRFLQMARNAIGTKDKVEPFNFLSESFVKLNDIEYVMRNLDKLEQEIGVDRCADIIAKQDTLTNGTTYKLPPKDERFVFTIKIIEAEDLKACDPNGYSDPYLVLGDEKQKRLLKTRTIYRNLNPRWDETVDITTQRPLQLVATVWDYDFIGDHDYVGRTSLKLDPSQYRDYLPREDWFDLDTQGRLLVRISMEGERDDIQFYFGRAFRTLKKTEKEMTRSITEKLSIYIRQSLSRERLRSLTNRGISSSVTSALNYFNRTKPTAAPTNVLTEEEIVGVIEPLFVYFDENFAIMKQTLTDTAMITVMTRLWKDVLLIIETLMVPPMSDKLSSQRPLTRQELDVVFVWLKSLFDFFAFIDPETGQVCGVPLNILKSAKWDDIHNLRKSYFDSTADLIQTSELISSASAAWYKEQTDSLNRDSNLSTNPGRSGSSLQVPHTHMLGGVGNTSTLMAAGSIRRRKTVMMSRSLGTMRAAKEEKRRALMSEPRDDNILRILRMRPDAERYLKERARQKQRLAAQQAAEAIVRQSLAGTVPIGRK